MEKASLDTFFGEKRARLDIEDIVPTPTADAADESNVEDRSLFCFSVRYCIIADQHFEVLEYIRMLVSFCMHCMFAINYTNVACRLIVLTCKPMRPRF